MKWQKDRRGFVVIQRLNYLDDEGLMKAETFSDLPFNIKFDIYEVCLERLNAESLNSLNEFAGFQFAMNKID